MARLAALWIIGLLVALSALLPAGPVGAARIADISNTKHNLSITGPGTLKATSETQICVFCHTPHGAEVQPAAPLWNRKFSSATYTTYSSSSIEASVAEISQGPGSLSRLCLSCHDGTMAISNVNVINGKANQTIALTGTGPGDTMATGSYGTTTGFTRNLGTDLSNDHPISFTYNSNLAAADGELRAPDGTLVGRRQVGQPKPKLPLAGGVDPTDPNGGKMQCTTCHDPHLRETDALQGAGKFLRANRFQKAAPTGGAFSEANDIICLACHDKAGQAWAFSAHANPQVADEVFTTAAANQREFPTSPPAPSNLPVWRAACLSCHDSHTVQGARRLLREGTDSVATPKAGGGSAIEETCYQCHAKLAESALTNVTSVPNIKDDFTLVGNRHMPIRSSDQVAGAERHDIGTGGPGTGKDFVESQALLGKGVPGNRHVECTDCHNPHRVTRNRLFNANAATPDTSGTHNHAAGHTNIASGVLRGGTGVEPQYGAADFGSAAGSYDLKRGDGGAGASTAVGSAWVTREYQVCLKCHSSYAYNTPPNLGDSAGGTPSGTNGLTQFTDQAMEFQAPTGHRGETTTTDSGAFAGQIRVPAGCATCGAGGCTCYNVDFRNRNHRAWHPVMGDTGRTVGARGITSTSPWLAPWGADVGTQTMYCTDCHGSNTAAGTVVPNAGNPWGPHGSANNFILKGTWSSTSGTADSSTVLCLKCHNSTVYAQAGDSGKRSAFYDGAQGKGNLHNYHTEKIGKLRCTWCHVAVPHGWKNRSFLVNLNDVGPEGGLAAGTQVRNKTTAAYNNPPYYLNAVLKIKTFGTPGSWVQGNCGSAGAPGNGATGRDWMENGRTSPDEGCKNAP